MTPIKDPVLTHRSMRGRMGPGTRAPRCGPRRAWEGMNARGRPVLANAP
jgi:hypothetical protein